MNYIAAGLIILTILSVGLGIQLVRTQMRFGDIRPTPTEYALALSLADCWALVTVIATWLVRSLPCLQPVWKWVDSLAHRIASGWNEKLPFANPAIHPWGFAFAFAVLFGFAIMAMILFSEWIKEGSPPTPATGLLLAGIFFAGESIAIFISFLLFGGFLGLRPKLNLKFKLNEHG